MSQWEAVIAAILTGLFALTVLLIHAAMPKGKKDDFVTNGLSKLGKKERKLVQQIFRIITDNTDRDVSELLIKKIVEELKK